ncbi:MAG: hypothetical protein PUB80_01155, partial [Clostridiales bacterium]|nr:hypothetical protein [Clostridiales bacterium]
MTEPVDPLPLAARDDLALAAKPSLRVRRDKEERTRSIPLPGQAGKLHIHSSVLPYRGEPASWASPRAQGHPV